MLLKAKLLRLEAKKPIVILNEEDAAELDVRPLDRIELDFKGKKVIAIVNVAERFIKQGEIGVYGEIEEKLKIENKESVKVNPTEPPESLTYIRNKLAGKILKAQEIREIVEDTVNNKLSGIELTAFVTSLYDHSMTMDEVAALSEAMAITGKALELGKKEIYDKHSIGGIPGDKTSILLVPIVAAAGLTIPKTSSRAITSPAGTADRFECLAPVDLSLEEIKKVVLKTNGCIVWGGAVDLAPADDIFIQIEYPLSIDPLLLPSVMSKKKAIGAKYLVVDIPTGRGTKMKTIGEAEELAKRFIELGKKLRINTVGISTYGEQPLGYAIGPALEAREALQTMMNGKGPQDLIEKVANLAGILIGFKAGKNAKNNALRLLKSGKADRKLREIIEAQGGDAKIKPEDLIIGQKRAEVRSNTLGNILWINNTVIALIARAAGTPKDKGAGVLLNKKIGDKVKQNEILFEIFANKTYKLNRALKLANQLNVIGIGKRFEMLLKKIPSIEERKYFILER